MNDANAFAVGLVADVRDTLDPLLLRGFRDLLDQSGFADLVGDFGKDDGSSFAAALFDMMTRAKEDRAPASRVGTADARLAKDEAAGRKVRSFDMLHQRFRTDRRIIDIGPAGSEDFAKVMRWDVGGHAAGDSAGAIDEQIGEAGRKDLRLAFGRVIIGLEVDRVAVDVAKEEVGDFGKTRLGVPHGRWRIGVHRPEIALAVDQWNAH